MKQDDRRLVSQPERVDTYLRHPEAKRLPFSCTLAVLKKDSQLEEVLNFIALSLKGGAGVKIVIERDFVLEDSNPDFCLYQHIDPKNPDSAYFHDVLNPNQFNKDLSELDHTTVRLGDSLVEIMAGVSQVFQLARQGVDNVLVDLSLLRTRGTVNSDGLKASGSVTFTHLLDACEFHIKRGTLHSLLRLLGVLNSVVAQGGYKGGIVTSAIHYDSPYFERYLDVPLVSLPGSHKKGVILSATEHPSLELLTKILGKVNSESLFLQKEYDDETYANVCMGIRLKDRGTCLIIRINLGQVTELEQIKTAFEQATVRAITLHTGWRRLHPDRAKMWADIKDDRQVAVDVMGLSSLLHRFDISYDDFINALHGEDSTEAAKELVETFGEAYRQSSITADHQTRMLGLPSFKYLHTVEPAQSHSYRALTADGYTVSRGIWTPFSRLVSRKSEREQVKVYDYGEVETHMEPHQHFRLNDGWMKLMSNNGRAHTISFDTLEDFTPEVFDKWFNSSLETLYYNMAKDFQTDTYARKGGFNIPSLVDDEDGCSVCAA